MKKIYRLENLECAICAAKMETAIKKIEGVDSASVSFMSARLTIEAEENMLDTILDKAQKAIKKIEPDCVIKR